eukprot:COSAG01_NODE_57828_length_309_cov_13.566667_1_plen_31_part_01
MWNVLEKLTRDPYCIATPKELMGVYVHFVMK